MSKNLKIAPLMPKAKAVWLIQKTGLSFEQIANFCNLHITEVQAIADDDTAIGIIGESPILAGELSEEEIKLCSLDSARMLHMNKKAEQFFTSTIKTKKTKYIPVARRCDKPDAIIWLLKNCPEMTEQQITKLIGTTKPTIESVRNKEHWNTANIKPRDPVLLGLCNQVDLDAAITKAKKSREEEDLRRVQENQHHSSSPTQ